MMLGFQTIIVGLQADVIAANRKILEDVQRRVRDMSSNGRTSESESKKHEKRN